MQHKLKLNYQLEPHKLQASVNVMASMFRRVLVVQPQQMSNAQVTTQPPVPNKSVKLLEFSAQNALAAQEQMFSVQ